MTMTPPLTPAEERAQLILLCERLGAPSAQAATMADQLLKRCDQLAAERGWERVRAMQHLLTLLIQGRQGQTPPGFEGGPPPPPATASPADPAAPPPAAVTAATGCGRRVSGGA